MSTPFPHSLGVLILAAGKGTRMYSSLPKVLQPVLREPMLAFVLKAAKGLSSTIWTVVGHKAESIQELFPKENFILQEQQLGTGHALQTAWQTLVQSGISHVVVINGDTPLITPEILQDFVEQGSQKQVDLAFISLTLPDPASFGRVLRTKNVVTAIIEAKDYDDSIHGPEPHEINAGIYYLNIESITPLLSQLTSLNKSKELYITDLIGLAAQNKLKISAINMGNNPALLGVNTPAELVRSESMLRANIVQEHLENGVCIYQANSVRIGPNVILERGASLTGPCELYGTTHIHEQSTIESHCVIIDTVIQSHTHVRSFCHFEKAHIGAHSTLGPYARLRPEAELEDKVHIGNFVEVKKSLIHEGAKVNHLTYIGDAEIGKQANIGAGTITCNYDGKNKHKTTIGERSFIGSNTCLVAPVTIGDEALIGAGSVITKDVPKGMLAIGRSRQTTLPKRK